MAQKIKRYRLTVSGRVQGVGLRWQIKNQAEKLGLGGWVKNQNKINELIVEIIGQPAAMEDFINWLKSNPGAAQIEAIKITELRPIYQSDFKIKHVVWPFL